MEIQSLLLVKTKLTIVLCSALAALAVFGQTTFTWTNSMGGQLDLAAATNWNPNGVPLPNHGGGDTMLFDGQSIGPVIGRSNSGLQTGSSAAGVGLVVHLTAHQVSPVTFDTTVANTASSGIRFKSIIMDSGAASFQLGSDSMTNSLEAIWGGAGGEIANFVNNSVNPMIFTPNLRVRFGGGGNHTFFFQGTGDFHITNDLIGAGGIQTSIAKSGPGTMIWTTGRNPFSGGIGSSSIQGPVILNGGTLILRSSTLLQSSIVTAPLTLQNNDGSIPALLEWDAPSSGTIGLAIGGFPGTLDLQVNAGTLTLSSAASSFIGNVLLSGGEVIAGGADNGFTGPLGSSANPISFTGGTLGFSTNNIFDYSSRFDPSPNQAYSFDTAGQNVTFASALTSSGGTLTKLGSGTLTLAGTNTYTGPTTVSNGTLVVGLVGGDMNVSGGTLAPAAAGAIGTLTVASNMNMTSGTVLVSLNKTLSPSNSTFTVAGDVNNAGGTLKLLNVGPALAPGDKFIVFSQPVTGGAAMTIVLPGVTFANNLAVDGSITVSGFAPSPAISATSSGGQLVLSWPDTWTGLHLQSQTNPAAIGLSTSWVTIAGTDGANGYTNTLNVINGSVFYRLAP